MQRFSNKFILVTGGTNGIGFATAREFIREGAKVIITGRSNQTVNNATALLGAGAFGIVSDSGRMQDVFSLRQHVQKYTGRVDTLFVNAGYGKFAPVETAAETHYDELFNMLVKGTFFTVQQVLPLMKEGGSIVLNTSFVTGFGLQHFSVYTAAKAAVASFIKTFAAEFTSKSIRVNGVSPGHITTNIFNNTGLTQEQISSTVQHITATLPFKRFGDPVEIARTVLFLASDEASYIHGTEVHVDGGLSVIR